MKRRLVIYFHYDPRGQVDETCRLAVHAMREASQALIFVTNGTLRSADRQWAQSAGITLRERENLGYDVGAYKETLLALGGQGLSGYDELILMNYTIAGPVCNVSAMLQAMEAKPELDFWGLTRHYAMRSQRFQTEYGFVPEHIQSHFIALRPRLFNAAEFWQYWQTMHLPTSYEQAVALHEARFTRYFAEKGYRWDTYVDTAPLRQYFVNPLMACPALLLKHKNCPFFKRRSFFTPYGDELRRTDGRAAQELYHYLKTETDYPIDQLIAELFQTQPLTALSRNLHWHYPVLQSAPVPIQVVDAAMLAKGFAPMPNQLYCLPTPVFGNGTAAWYEQQLTCEASAQAAAALFAQAPLLGLAGPALPLFAACAAQKRQRWQADLPTLKQKITALGLTVPCEEAEPLPLPNGGYLLLRGSAFAQGVPPLTDSASWWLLPLLAQQNGFYSATFESAAQSAARADIMATQLGEKSVGGAAKELARTIKHRMFRQKEGKES